MWFKPDDLLTKSTPVANSANSANHKAINSEISRISEISGPVSIENLIPETSGLAKLAVPTYPVSCGKCLNFRSHNAHGKGAGICSIGGDYGLWSETQHQCNKFNAAVEWQKLPDLCSWQLEAYRMAGQKHE